MHDPLRLAEIQALCDSLAEELHELEPWNWIFAFYWSWQWPHPLASECGKKLRRARLIRDFGALELKRLRLPVDRRQQLMEEMFEEFRKALELEIYLVRLKLNPNEETSGDAS